MSKGQESLKRSVKRSDKRKKTKMDKILNILIAIVSILIILNVLAIFNDNNKGSKTETETASQNKNNDTNKEETPDEKNTEPGNQVAAEEIDGKELAEAEDEILNEPIIQSSDDPLVEKVIIDPSWEVNPTNQTGEHVSAFEEGHIDYEEKLVAIRNAVQLDENNIIYWSVRNNGGPNQSVAVVSTGEKTDYYRVYIEWIDQKGWKPVKVEKLNQAIGAR